MIYNTNRIAGIGDVNVGADKRYFGSGAYDFMQECAQDELAMFESAIRSDIEESCISESYELQALNEGFVQTAVAKIKEIMKKFIAWVEAVLRSAYAKLSTLLVRDNGKFCKIARKQITKMKNVDNFKLNCTRLTIFSKISLDKKGNSYFADIAKAEKVSDKDIKDLEDFLEKQKTITVSDYIEKNTTDDEITGKDALSSVQNHLNLLEELSKKYLKEVKDDCNKMKSDAKSIAAKADKLEKKLKDDASEEDKTNASNKVKAANLYKEYSQVMTSHKLSLIKKIAKICRTVVSKAMAASPVSEAVLLDAMNESVLLEYDDALEGMSEGGDECDNDTDEDILDDGEEE